VPEIHDGTTCDLQSDTPVGGGRNPFGITSLFIPAKSADVIINGKKAPGNVYPQKRGPVQSSSALAERPRLIRSKLCAQNSRTSKPGGLTGSFGSTRSDLRWLPCLCGLWHDCFSSRGSCALCHIIGRYFEGFAAAPISKPGNRELVTVPADQIHDRASLPPLSGGCGLGRGNHTELPE
jgi:hypothetical protein